MTVYEHFDETISIGYGPHIVGRYESEGMALVEGKIKQSKAGKVMAINIAGRAEVKEVSL